MVHPIYPPGGTRATHDGFAGLGGTIAASAILSRPRIRRRTGALTFGLPQGD